ncbi:GntR family transcriptional regulator [Chelatococcus sambhunathii]|uniref:GntR family transcriptional regulator n=1 Tax=Chelatococcus sambhunathii TaxID=363953 RepID=A0ABU1DIQ4_9HYPH|nr:GntR family transcriptional regulator [Chelatococcus sambhunathii]MDR4307987.1 GntR family transcriptional regulator [Chelatococcus sambhunathii]
MTENAVRKVRDEIENAVVSGDLAPGERLDEVQLATRFGVSRTPVREALMQLSAIGMVELRPRRGAIVVSHGPARIYEMFEVMAELEGLAGAHAARRLDAKDRATIAAAHEGCRAAAETNDRDGYYYENETFHFAIYAASHSEFLAEQCGALHRRLRPFRRLQLRVANRLMASFEEHDAVVQAIFSGDAEQARARLRAHVVVQGDRFGDLLSAYAETARRNTG